MWQNITFLILPIGSTMWNMTSQAYITYRRRTEPRSPVTCTENLVKLDMCFWNVRANKQTNRHADIKRRPKNFLLTVWHNTNTVILVYDTLHIYEEHFTQFYLPSTRLCIFRLYGAIQMLFIIIIIIIQNGMSHPAFTLQPQRITTLWPVLISSATEGSRLRWPGWLVTYRGGMPAR